ncbi:MAG: GNAT family N-acetyltransferase [Nocardioidaceae bacterium]
MLSGEESTLTHGRDFGGGTLEIRRATPADAETVALITVESYVADGFIAEHDSYIEELSDAENRLVKAEVWVCAVDGVVAGAVAFCPPGSSYRELAAEGEGEFRMLAVQPRWRGRGVGRALVQRCLDRSGELGLTDLVLCSLPEMTPAHALYQSMGFTRDASLDWEVKQGVTLIGFRITV